MYFWEALKKDLLKRWRACYDGSKFFGMDLTIVYCGPESIIQQAG